MSQRSTRVLAALAIGALVLTGAALAQDKPNIRITVTNLTAGQILSPPLVIAHNENFQLFAAATPASAELAALAEDADVNPLIAQLAVDPNVLNTTVGTGVIPPGSSLEIEVDTNRANRFLTIAGMLVSTNDAFFAAQGLEADPGTTLTMNALAYDAGSEANNEDCTYIPGPPCGNPGVRTPTSEGFIHIHNGVHGIASLAPSLFDWRSPVARITVEFVTP